MRILSATVEVASEVGTESATVTQIVRRAGVSSGTFYALFEDRQDCLTAVFEEAVAIATKHVSAAYDTEATWVDRVRAAVLALLERLDEERELARLCVGHAVASPTMLLRREEVLDELIPIIDQGRSASRACRNPPPLAAQVVLGGALGLIYARLSARDPCSLVELLNPLMFWIVLPYLGASAAREEQYRPFLGAHAARRELRRPVDATSAVEHSVPLGLLQDPGKGLSHHRTVHVLRVLAAEPGLNNGEVALRAGVKDGGGMSRILARMARLGLITNTLDAGARGPKRAWQLTASGEQLEAAIGREAAAAASMAFDVPEEFGGRMDYRAVSVLRVIGDQPWLYSREVALRAGIKDPAQIARLLAHLAGRGLVASTRDVHRKGTPNAWRLTVRGEELDRTIGRETPPPPRSLALDLMWQSGGRLSDSGVSVLRVSGVEPGLSNVEIALRVGISDQNSMSQLLARLARRGLIENTRTRGRYNVWQLTAAGRDLESTIRKETPAPVARRIALDLLKNRGGRLNHRVVSVLRVIGAEPGLSNDEIALHVGIKSRGTTSTLLGRLARFGLIENTRTGGRVNVWQLTATGKELEAAIRHENPDAGQVASAESSVTLCRRPFYADMG